jgi:hypothetical protein
VPDLVGSAVPTGRLREQIQPTFRIGELTLRPFRALDARDLREAYRDPGIQRWHVRSMTENEAHEWIASSAARWSAETGANWAVTDDGGALVGRVGFRRIDLTVGLAEISYWTIPAARGRGVATRAARAMRCPGKRSISRSWSRSPPTLTYGLERGSPDRSGIEKHRSRSRN